MPEQPAASNPQTTAPTCRCGYTRQHPLVTSEARYSMFHYVLGIFMGVSGGEPKSVQYRCSRCGTLIEESTAREDIIAHRW